MIFNTQNSAYEVEEGIIRRLSGVNDPTPYQGPDGEWKEYLSITSVEVGLPVVIHWHDEKHTVTSPVKTVATCNECFDEGEIEVEADNEYGFKFAFCPEECEASEAAKKNYP